MVVVLPRAVGTNHPQDRSGIGGEAHVLYHFHAAECLADTSRLDDCHAITLLLVARPTPCSVLARFLNRTRMIPFSLGVLPPVS